MMLVHALPAVKVVMVDINAAMNLCHLVGPDTAGSRRIALHRTKAMLRTKCCGEAVSS